MYGPNTDQVQALIAQARTMTPEQSQKIISAWDAERGSEARYVVWNVARGAGRGEAREAAWDAARDTDRYAHRAAVCEAAVALVVRDLISEEHFRVLYGPWGSVFGEPK